MSCLGILQTLDRAKLRVGFTKQGDLDDLLLLGYVIIRGCIKFVFTFNVARNWQQLKNLISSSARLEQDSYVVSIYFTCSHYACRNVNESMYAGLKENSSVLDTLRSILDM